MRTLSFGYLAPISVARSRTDDITERSATNRSTDSFLLWSFVSSLAASPRARSRQTMMTWAPAAASLDTVARPRPALAPLTRTSLESTWTRASSGIIRTKLVSGTHVAKAHQKKQARTETGRGCSFSLLEQVILPH